MFKIKLPSKEVYDRIITKARLLSSMVIKVENEGRLFFSSEGLSEDLKNEIVNSGGTWMVDTKYDMY